MIIQVDKEKYDTFSETEKTIVNYLNEHEMDVPDMSITMIANQTFTSISTVSRAIHKCGFQSISELKYKILSNRNQKDEPLIANELLVKAYRECLYTIDNICSTHLLKVCEYIKHSEKIFIFACGHTVFIAEEFQMHLQLLGYNAHIIKDPLWMQKANHFLNDHDVAIFLTVQNTIPELSVAAQLVKTVGAKIVTCCCIEHTSLEQYSDVTMIGHSEEVMKAKSFSIKSRLPLYIITRAIIEYLNT